MNKCLSSNIINIAMTLLFMHGVHTLTIGRVESRLSSVENNLTKQYDSQLKEAREALSIALNAVEAEKKRADQACGK